MLFVSRKRVEALERKVATLEEQVDEIRQLLMRVDIEGNELMLKELSAALFPLFAQGEQGNAEMIARVRDKCGPV